ncbi:MAG TPA: hotdog domain-containing protein [Phycisphaerae bacterium]|mgnify:CR=1 FL=1|nr:hotdog domain-containing protein [Phycisphaerae bacterium]HRW54235.1 hotdog domain-containing protein [Phycisphaerae bacterium]
MKPELKPGVERDVSFVVTEAMCPAFDDVVVHRVCATWTLVHYMELAGRRVLVDYLEPDEEGVGSRVVCDHLGPAPIGSEVVVRAVATRVTDRILDCDVECRVGDRVVATGMTGQRVFPRAVLRRILGEA